MKLFKNYLFLFFLLSGVILTSCSSDDDDNNPTNTDDEYLISQLDVTYGDQVKRPLFKLAYETNGDLSTATYYYYNIGEEQDAPDKVELDETVTYKFVRSANKITVNCSSVEHSEADEVSEWVTTLTLNNGNIVSVENASDEPGIVTYAWKNGKLQSAYNYTFTYNGNNIDKAVEESTDSYDDFVFDEKCMYTLTCNTQKANSFSLIPVELIAVTGDATDVLVLALCNNEITKSVHTDSYITKNKSDNSVIREEIDDVISDYTYSYDKNNMVTSVTVKDTDNDKSVDSANPDNNWEETTTSSYSLHFEYIKKSK